MRRFIALLFVLTLAPWASAPAQEADDVRSIIEAHNQDLVRWYAAGEIDSVASTFAEDAWQMPPNSPPLVGREAIREFWSRSVQWGEWNFTLQTEDVTVSGPMAVERGSYVLALEPGPDAPPGLGGFEDRGNYLVHWRLEEDGEWRIVADAPVSEIPPPSAGTQPATAPAADPTDVASIDAIVDALYDVISGPAGERDWERFRTLFAPGALLVPAAPGSDGPSLQALPVDGYVERVDEYFSENPFYEVESARESAQFGNVASLMSEYESRRDPSEEPFARGINAITLVTDGERWYVVSVAWDVDRPGNEIPSDFGTDPTG